MRPLPPLSNTAMVCVIPGMHMWLWVWLSEVVLWYCTVFVCLFRNRSKLVNYRLVKERSSGVFYIHSHTSFPSLQLLLTHYKDAPINPDVNTRLLSPIVTQQQQQQQQQPSTPIRGKAPKPQKSMKQRPLPQQPQPVPDSMRSDRLNGGDDNYVTMQKSES